MVPDRIEESANIRDFCKPKLSHFIAVAVAVAESDSLTILFIRLIAVASSTYIGRI